MDGHTNQEIAALWNKAALRNPAVSEARESGLRIRPQAFQRRTTRGRCQRLSTVDVFGHQRQLVHFHLAEHIDDFDHLGIGNGFVGRKIDGLIDIGGSH